MTKKVVKDRAYYEQIARQKGRLKEPSTMAGVAALAGGMNEIFQVVEPETAGALVDAVTTVAVNPSPLGLAMAAFGLFSIFMKEGGK